MTLEEAKALGFGEGEAANTNEEADEEVGAAPEGDVVTDDNSVPDADEVAIDLDTSADEPAEEQDESKPQGDKPKAGPPKMLPYDRFQQENRAKRAAEARAAAAEAELARRDAAVHAPAPKPKTPLTEDQEFIREALKEDLDAARADTAEVREWIAQQKDQAEADKFWKQNADVDEVIQLQVEEEWQNAQEIARTAGQSLKFTREHLLLLAEGQAARQARKTASVDTSKVRQAASDQKKKVGAINRNARGVATGNTVGRPGPKQFKDMTLKEQEDALSEVII